MRQVRCGGSSVSPGAAFLTVLKEKWEGGEAEIRTIGEKGGRRSGWKEKG